MGNKVLGRAFRNDSFVKVIPLGFMADPDYYSPSRQKSFHTISHPRSPLGTKGECCEQDEKEEDNHGVNE